MKLNIYFTAKNYSTGANLVNSEIGLLKYPNP